MEKETGMAMSQQTAILMPTIRLVERCREPRGFLMPKYRPRLMKHMCQMLAEHASTSQVTYTLHQCSPSGQWPPGIVIVEHRGGGA